MKYLDSFRSGFTDRLEETELLFMQSDGGLTDSSRFKGSNAILSGPAGGVVGYAMTTELDMPVIGFDMGGTSTDVSRYGEDYELVHETETAGVRIQAPQMDIRTVAAGGGSRLFFRKGMFEVGPESAGAPPGHPRPPPGLPRPPPGRPRPPPGRPPAAPGRTPATTNI